MLQPLAFEAEQSGRVCSARLVRKTRRAAHAADVGASAAAAVEELLAEELTVVELLLFGAAVTSASQQFAAYAEVNMVNVASAAETTVFALLQTAAEGSLVDLAAQEDK
jgi:hypothetical protein